MSTKLSLDELKENYVPETPMVEQVSDVEALKPLSKEEMNALTARTTKEIPTAADAVQEHLSELDNLLQTREDKAKKEVIIPAEEAAREAIEENFDEVFTQEVRDIASGVADVEYDKIIEKTTEDASVKEIENPLFEEDDTDSNFTFDIDELSEDLGVVEDDYEEEDSNRMIKKLKAELSKSIDPIKNKLDLSKYMIAKKPISVKSFLSEAGTKLHTADWVLYSSKQLITMSEFGGSEIDLFDPNNMNGSGTLTKLKKVYECLYRHVESDKPSTLQEWLKTIKFYDQPHLYMAAYRATFSHSNLMNYTCPKCNEPIIKEVKISDIVKYESDDVKKEVDNILNSVYSSDEVDVTLVQVSDNYVIGFKSPSVYDIMFEIAALDQSFQNKYSDLLGIISFIDTFYKIDSENKNLIPVELKIKEGKFAEMVKAKIRAYAEIITVFDSDSYSIILDTMGNMNKRNDVIKYIQPECTCPKCNTKIEEIEMDPQTMLFTRHQLPLIKTLSTK